VKAGIYPDIPNAEYHGWPGLSNSGISTLLRTPWHYWSLHLDPDRPARPETASQRAGTVAHAAILEPDTFDDRFPVMPFADRRTKAAKDWIAALRADQTAITAEERATALRQRDAVLSLPDVADAMKSGQAEVSAVWDDGDTPCRCRPDWVYSFASGVVLFDVKTCGDASPDEFRRQVARHGYHRQAAWYSDGYAAASGKQVFGFVFVAVEAAYPHAASAVMLDEDALAQGRLECRRALDLYAECSASGRWPSYPPGIETISLPAYALEAA
jgi:exodeoxyribonuclease VIII